MSKYIFLPSFIFFISPFLPSPPAFLCTEGLHRHSRRVASKSSHLNRWLKFHNRETWLRERLLLLGVQVFAHGIATGLLTAAPKAAPTGTWGREGTERYASQRGPHPSLVKFSLLYICPFPSIPLGSSKWQGRRKNHMLSANYSEYFSFNISLSLNIYFLGK